MPKDKFLYKRIYSDLKEKIRGGQFGPEDKIPGENELRDFYQVSAITVKRAMQMLVDDNLVKRIQGKGTFITEEAAIAEMAVKPELQQEIVPLAMKGKNKLIGVIFEYATQSFGLDLMFALDKAAMKAGYRVCMRFSYSDQEKERQEIEFLKSIGIEGLIIMPCHGFYYNTELLKLAIDDFPVVVLDKKMEGIQVPSIRTDNADAVDKLIDYLKAQGKNQIGMIAVDGNWAIALVERRDAFREYIRELRLPVVEECILPQETYRITKYKPIEDYVVRVQEYLQKYGRKLDAVVCMEYGNLLAFQDAVRRMKGEASHILACCIDKVETVPGMRRYPHIRQDEVTMAENAVELIIRQINGEKVAEQEIKVPGILRE